MTIGFPAPVTGQYACSVCGTLLGINVNNCPQCIQNELLAEANEIKRAELQFQREQNRQVYIERPLTQEEYEREVWLSIQRSLSPPAPPVSTANPFLTFVFLCIASVLAYWIYKIPLSALSFTLGSFTFLSLVIALWYSE